MIWSATSDGASQSPYEQALALQKRAGSLEAESKAIKAEADALVAALKPKEEPAKEQTTWAPASSTQVPNAQASVCVTHKPEIHADNTAFNAYVPTDSELSAFHTAAASFSPLSKYVDGRAGLSSPSTDDLIQWGACKWGIPTDWLRADYVVESGWHHLDCGARGKACDATGGPAGTGVAGSGFGDCGSGVGPSAATNAPGCSGTYTSVGISQVKEQSCCHPGTYPLAYKSTAFNVDYMASIVRYYFDGLCGWCSYAYRGQEWPSIGAWFSPGSNSTGAVDYQKKVQAALAAKPWLQPGF